MVNNSSVRKKKEKLHSFTLEYYLKIIKLTGLNLTFINNVTLQINRPFPFCNLQDDSSKLFICKLLFLYWIDVWGSLCLPGWFMFCMQMDEWLALVSTLVMSYNSSVERDVRCCLSSGKGRFFTLEKKVGKVYFLFDISFERAIRKTHVT